MHTHTRESKIEEQRGGSQVPDLSAGRVALTQLVPEVELSVSNQI